MKELFDEKGNMLCLLLLCAFMWNFSSIYSYLFIYEMFLGGLVKRLLAKVRHFC